MELTTSGWEILFNYIYFGLAIGLGGLVIFMCKWKKLVYYGYIFWGVILIFFAACLLNFYSASLKLFIDVTLSTTSEEAVRKNLIENLEILVFIVPGVMLAVAANLITDFLKLDNPQK